MTAYQDELKRAITCIRQKFVGEVFSSKQAYAALEASGFVGYRMWQRIKHNRPAEMTYIPEHKLWHLGLPPEDIQMAIHRRTQRIRASRKECAVLWCTRKAQIRIAGILVCSTCYSRLRRAKNGTVAGYTREEVVNAVKPTGALPGHALPRVECDMCKKQIPETDTNRFGDVPCCAQCRNRVRAWLPECGNDPKIALGMCQSGVGTIIPSYGEQALWLLYMIFGDKPCYTSQLRAALELLSGKKKNAIVYRKNAQNRGWIDYDGKTMRFVEPLPPRWGAIPHPQQRGMSTQEQAAWFSEISSIIRAITREGRRGNV